MIGLAPAGAAAAMGGILALLDDAPVAKARLQLYAGTRPATGGVATTLVAEIELNKPAGTVDGAGALALAVPTSGGAVVDVSAPTWARLRSGTGAIVLDADVRWSTDPDLNEEVVVLSAVLALGGLVRITVGTLSVT